MTIPLHPALYKIPKEYSSFLVSLLRSGMERDDISGAKDAPNKDKDVTKQARSPSAR